MKKTLTLILFLISIGLQAQEVAQKAFSEGVLLLKSKNFIEAEKQFTIAILKGETKKGLKMSYIYNGLVMS